VLTDYIRCEGEIRQCFLSYEFDSGFDDALQEWHSSCDRHVATPVTTPVVATPWTTINFDKCSTMLGNCEQFLIASSACRSSYAAPTDLLSCACQSSMISMDSVCNYDAKISCFLTTAQSSDLLGALCHEVPTVSLSVGLQG
jgi:hypothetical protein